MKKLLLVALVLVVASTSMAREITPLNTDLAIPGADRYEGDCVVGNNNFDGIVGYYGEWFYGFENYTVPFIAGEEACACANGVAIKSIHMLLALDDFANLQIAVAVLDAVDGGGGCLVPGAEIAVSSPYTISGITGGAQYIDVEIPIDGPCATVGDPLFLGVYFLNDNDTQLVGLPITDPPHTCFNYNDWGSGYVDVVDSYGFAGDLLIWADLDCCAEPVDNEASTLDSIKSLYR